MTPSSMFVFSSLFAGIGWIIVLVASPFWPGFDKWVVGIIVALLACLYTWLNFSNFSPDILKNFQSLEGVQTLYKNPDLVLASWVHFLVFDLFGAVWIKKNSLRYGIPHIWIIPSLILTCMFGPFGLLLYFLTRWVKTKNYFSENF